MYELNDIVAMLQNGASMESIAAQMTQCLNDAKAEYEKREAEKKAAEEAAKKAAEEDAMAANRREILSDLLANITDYCAIARPHAAITKVLNDKTLCLNNEELDEFADQLDSLIDTYEWLTTLDLNGMGFKMPVIKKVEAETPKTKTHKDPIDEFLNNFVRK